jgi:hypothetical protein
MQFSCIEFKHEDLFLILNSITLHIVENPYIPIRFRPFHLTLSFQSCFRLCARKLIGIAPCSKAHLLMLSKLGRRS